MVDYPDIINLTHDELLDEYCKLFDKFQDLREASEEDTQKIYELKRSLGTATAAQAYLSQELEQYANSDNKDIEKELHKTRIELQDMKKKCNNLEASFNNLQQDYSLLLEENVKITKNLEESQRTNQQNSNEIDTKIEEDYLSRIQSLENENMDLLHKIEDFEERSIRYTLTIAECEKNIEILTDQITCLEENLQSKRLDLEEKLQILESTQEQLSEANAKIAMFSAAPDNNDRKGNSLFAEVDDQRQAMKQLLVAQKRSYVQMKKIYNDSEHEIRRLKRENISMQTEFEACSTIFCNADKIYQEKLNERIHCLINQNEELEQKLKWTQERMKELAADKGVLLFDSMLSFCKKETDELKSQLHRVRLQNASLEEQLRTAQQDMARWRFESLRSRCVLIDREHLLAENNINFKPMHAMEYSISEKDIKQAKPRIVSNRRSSILENIITRTSLTPSKVPIKQETSSPQENIAKDFQISNNLENQFIENAEQKSIPCKNEEQTLQQELSGSEMKIKKSELGFSIEENIEINESLNISKNKEENKENFTIYIDDSPMLNNFAKLRSKTPIPPSPMRPSQNATEKANRTSPVHSILTKNDLLFTDSCKNVKFSSEADTVYNLSPDHYSSISSKDGIKTEVDSATQKSHCKNTVKQPRTKSNIIVRRVVVSSIHD